MKNLALATIVFGGLAVAACQPAGNDMGTEEPAPMGGPLEPATPPVAAIPEGVVLFAGSNLDSFNTLGEPEWNIIDDYVEAESPSRGFLVSKDTYADFRLQAEFYPGPGTNSGIFIRCQDPGDITAGNCYEINVADTNDNPDSRTGSVVGHAPPRVPVASDGQWNTMVIVADGPSITVTVNGTVTAEANDDGLASGPFALQINGGLIRFRNVRLGLL